MMAAAITKTDMRKCHAVEYGCQIPDIPKVFKCQFDIQRPCFVNYSVQPVISDLIDREFISGKMDHCRRNMMRMTIFHAFQVKVQNMISLQIIQRQVILAINRSMYVFNPKAGVPCQISVFRIFLPASELVAPP